MDTVMEPQVPCASLAVTYEISAPKTVFPHV